MQKTTLGKTGLRVSPLGFGAAEIGFLGVGEAPAARLLHFLLDRGVNLIDTAAMYGKSEEYIGKGIGHRRDEFVLVSKCGTAVGELWGGDWSPSLIADSVDRSLRLLRTDRIDVMFLHSCPLDVLQRGEALAALVKARAAGKVRFVGYSGDNEALAYAAGLPEIDLVETSINLCDQANLDRLRPLQDQGVLAKRPLANGAWRPLDEQSGVYRGYAETYTKRFQAMGLDPRELGFRSGADWPEIALRFTLAQPGVHCAIVGTTKPASIEANLRAVEAGPLPEPAVEKIREAFLRAEKESGQKWEAET